MTKIVDTGSESSRAGTSRGMALLLASLLPLASLFVAAIALDVPGPGTPRLDAQAAALAVRDPVSPIETLATWAFVRPRLRAAYAEVRMFTQAPRRPDQWFNQDQREEFVAALRELCARHEAIDIWLLSHTSPFNGWVLPLEPEVRSKIRFVYHSGCLEARQSTDWLQAGADTYVAHPSVAPHIAFFVTFFRRLLAGVPLPIAVQQANDCATTFFGALARFGGPLREANEAWLVSLARIHGSADHTHGGR
jgi:hypothetical protein